MKSISIFNAVLRRYICSNKCFYASSNCYSTEGSSKIKAETLFIKPEVQNILTKITGLDLGKVFAPRNSQLKPHQYEFVTEERLKELQEKAKAKAFTKLQMPPVMSIREPIDEILSKDPELQGYLKEKTVFTDISTNITNRDRIITVREVDGTLRKANWEERERMIQIFFPLPGRSLEVPKLFESPNLERLLDSHEYIFVLDSACAQFEPDAPDYHRVTAATYEHIRRMGMFNVVRSTRHFGPMAFYFALRKEIDDLLVDMIKHNLISDASDTVKLLYIVNPELKTSSSADSNDIDIIQNYIKNASTKKGGLELALQTFFEQLQTKESQEAGMTEAIA
ncbi:hypothetical protein JTE90_028339 [Oedothorax gibbosus]|uniref:28S ribosomal protein S22, mitochondrial n=1 Tax=Oedothorax gibbosus TaxID=931172 RepID=A0AAV6V4M4_9ARAC|nr:hypothetical protein JTE90_028339 [Oedothorax gibbosus]